MPTIFFGDVQVLSGPQQCMYMYIHIKLWGINARGTNHKAYCCSSAIFLSLSQSIFFFFHSRYVRCIEFELNEIYCKIVRVTQCWFNAMNEKSEEKAMVSGLKAT